MATVTGNEYDHITISDGTNNTVHYLKDTAARNNLIKVQSTQPTETENKLWITGETTEVQVPTYDEFTDLKSATDSLYKVTMFQIELGTLNTLVPFPVDSGDKVTVYAKDGGNITVNQLKLRRANGTDDYWTISGYESRTITMTESFVGAYLANGTAQTLIIKRDNSYLDLQPQIEDLEAETSENTSTLTKVKEIVGIDEPTYAVTTGKYISYDGNITSGSAFEYSAPIEVKEGQKVVLVGEGYNTAVAMISLSNAAGTTITPKVISIDSTVRTYEYDVLADGYIIVCYYRTHQHKLTIYTDKIGTLERTVDKIADYSMVEPQTLNEGFIHRDGRIMEGANFRYTNPIRLENETIQFRAKGYSNVVSLLSTCDQNGGNRKNIINSTSEEVENITFSSDGVTYVIITSNVTVPIVYTSIKSVFPHDIPFVNLSLFQKFGVIGDSFASGALFFNNTYKEDYSKSWGQIMARNLGVTCTNYSKSGLTTKTWLTDSKGLSLVLSNDPEEIYYLVLGINDAYSLGSDYLGALTDITSHESYVDYPDTFYGNYGKIIEQIQGHAPHAKLVMFETPHVTEAAITYNAAIVEIANHYGIPYINQRDDTFITSSFYWDNMVKGHPIAIAYSGMASAFERLLNNCIKNNVDYFKDAFAYQ